MNGPKPTVALFSTSFLQYSQTFIYDEIRHHRRYRVEVFCQERLNPAQFPYQPVHQLKPRGGWLGELEAFSQKATTWSPRFHHRLATGDFRLLHAHFGPGSLYALPYRIALGLPLVVTYHGYDVPILMSRSRYLPRYLRYWMASGLMFRFVDRFLAASEELARLLVELGAPPHKVEVWRLGIEIPKADPPPRFPDQPLHILMVGRFVEKKGFDYGLQAVAEAIGRGVDLTVSMVGDGPYRSAYQRITRQGAIADKVRWLGVLSHDQVLDLMGHADLLLAPSVVARDGNRESGILVVKEANARGVPAIGTLHGGIPEIIEDGATGFLVPERDPGTLAERIVTLATHPVMRWEMGERARQKMIEEYDIVRRVEALEDHYDALL
ncbi:MAG: glycosyltransferase [Bradymonadales bacterium]|nr:glycosyltransferase [Bradymonadales bacterium]